MVSGQKSDPDFPSSSIPIIPILTLYFNSDDDIKLAEQFLGVPAQTLQLALKQNPNWKASEMLRFHSSKYHHHDIALWLSRPDSYSANLHQHMAHEKAHYLVDLSATQFNLGTHTWLTEGACEMAGSEPACLRKNAQSVQKQALLAGVPITWQYVRALLEKRLKNPRLALYDAGWLVVESIATTLSPKEIFQGLGEFLYHMSHATGPLNDRLDWVVANKLDQDALEQNIARLIQMSSMNA